MAMARLYAKQRIAVAKL